MDEEKEVKTKFSVLSKKGLSIFVGAFMLLGLFSAISFPATAGEVDNTLDTEQEEILLEPVQYNDFIPTDWNNSGIKQVEEGLTYYITPLGDLVPDLVTGTIYTVEHDGNLLLEIHSINEDACDLYANTGGFLTDLTVPEIKVLPVLEGQEFGLAFIVKPLDDLHCAVRFDINMAWSE